MAELNKKIYVKVYARKLIKISKHMVGYSNITFRFYDFRLLCEKYGVEYIVYKSDPEPRHSVDLDKSIEDLLQAIDWFDSKYKTCE